MTAKSKYEHQSHPDSHSWTTTPAMITDPRCMIPHETWTRVQNSTSLYFHQQRAYFVNTVLTLSVRNVLTTISVGKRDRYYSLARTILQYTPSRNGDAHTRFALGRSPYRGLRIIRGRWRSTEWARDWWGANQSPQTRVTWAHGALSGERHRSGTRCIEFFPNECRLR